MIQVVVGNKMEEEEVNTSSWNQPELQAFHLHSPPHSASSSVGEGGRPQSQELFIEVVDKVVVPSTREAEGYNVADSTAAASMVSPDRKDSCLVQSPPPPAVTAPPASRHEMQSLIDANGKTDAETPVTAGGKGEDVKPLPPLPTVGISELFRFADGMDCVLMAIGKAGAVVHGCSLPVFLPFFADLINSFGSNADDPDIMVREVVKYAFYFLVVGAAIWVSSWAEISCWMWTGEWQTTKMRIKYLESALNQDVRYFDTDVRASDVVYAINADAVILQDAISEKLGNFIHYMATFISGFVVGFTAAWQLALVTLSVVPLIAVIGGIHATTITKLSSKSQGALSQASNIAEQALAQIRTVQSFVGESRVLQT